MYKLGGDARILTQGSSFNARTSPLSGPLLPKELVSDSKKSLEIFEMVEN